MKIIDISDASSHLNNYAEKSDSETVVITKEGIPCAIMTPVQDEDWESVNLSTNPRFIALIEESRRSAKENGTISLDDICHRYGID